MKPTITQKIGLSLFISALLLLIATLFLNDYKLTPSNLKSSLDSAEYAKAKSVFSPLLNVNFSNSYSFNAELKTLLESANEKALEKYRITDAKLSHLLKAFPENNITYSSELIKQETSDTVTSYQIEKLKAYTNWMNGQTFESKKDLISNLNGSVKSINYNIAKDYGFESYIIKNMQLKLSKAASNGTIRRHLKLWIILTLGLGIMGGLLYILPKLNEHKGIKNDNIYKNANTSRGWIGYAVGAFLIIFYIILYWYPEYMVNWMLLADPFSYILNGGPASQWFFYGLLYTFSIAVMGLRMLIKYRHSKYHIVRTLSVIFFQTVFAFTIPEILIKLNQPSMDFKNMWPLNYSFFFEYNLNYLINSGRLGIFMLVWGIVLFTVGVPVLTYFYGKRWYCSWVCGCGGLAETLGDPYRQLSDKSVKAWKIERWMIHGVLVFAIIMTAGTIYTYFTGNGSLLGIDTYTVRSTYGFLIGSAFAGVVGVGFYPFMGSRVWCRFGCPLAAYLGIVQRFKSRFRITTNGGQCISCGNCSTYCEMGIDVRWYAQRGQNIVRASCVGCGVCSSVCPRGVLKLENNTPESRFNEPISIGQDSVKIHN